MRENTGLLQAQRRAKAAATLRNDRDIPKTAKLVGLELLDRTDKRTGRCWPSVLRLAEAIGCHERTIRRSIAALVARGYLLVVKRGGHHTDEYRLAISKLVGLSTYVRERIRSACDAARKVIHRPSRGGTGQQAPAVARPDILPAYPPEGIDTLLKEGTHNFARGGFWPKPGTPKGQVLTDQQLDGRARTRIWQALAQLGQSVMEQFIARPDAADLEAAAVRAERYSPNDGRTGLATIADRLRTGMPA